VEYLPYLISGLVTGSVYGLAGTGLVLTYKTSAIFNFAHGALAAVAAYGFYSLYVTHGLPWALAAAICVLLAAPLLGWGFELLARSLAQATLAVRVAATVGILLIIQAAIALIYGTTGTTTLPHFLPQASFMAGGVPVTAEDIIIVVLALAAAVSLYVFFKVSRLGIAMRAVVDNPDLLDVSGTSPQRVRRWAWVIGVAFALASGLLIGPRLASLDPVTITFLVITAFAAAALGGFTSLPLTYVGGLAIGLAQAFITKFFTTGFWASLTPTLPFLVLFVVLLVSPRRRLADRSPLIPRGRSAWRTPLPVQALGGVAVLAVLIAVPSFAGLQLFAWANALPMTVLFLSLGLLVRTSGQVSLCQVSFLAIGVCAMSQFTTVHHLPWLVALALSGLVAVPIGALLAIPAIRLSGLALALATLGFGLLLQQMFYGQNYMFGTFGLPVTVPRPHISWLATDKGYYYLLLVFACIATAAVIAVNQSRLGRLLRGLADSPPGLAATGTAITTSRVLVFCLSAFLAAIAGALQGGIEPVSSASYQPIQSLTYFAVVIISVGGAPWYALIAGLGLTLVPAYITNTSTSYWLELLFGVGALAYALTPESRRGGPAAVRRALDRFEWPRRPAVPVLAATAAATAAPAGVATGATTSGGTHGSGVVASGHARRRDGELSVDALRVRFGGLVAVDGVTLAAPAGRITGLIGPNGAGKTTILNACSGVLRPSGGRIKIDGANASASGASQRARRGLGRTFQQMELFDTLTVRQNVALGAEGRYADWNPLSHLVATPGQRRHVRAAASEAMALCGLQPIADATVGTLPAGQRRLVELARCLAGSFHILLLDEPSSGLDRAETRRLGEILRAVVAERGTGILLVEHDMSLVTEVCDHIYVVDFGQLIFEGTPAEMIASPVVQAAYLGDAELEAAIVEEAEESEVPAS
jgi:ABC-type branched-subunit amino acid transport system ATPase component/branched-subunit amino acid ABC-type transport system permease component